MLALEGEIDKEYKSLVKAERAKDANGKINYEILHQDARVNVLNRWLKKSGLLSMPIIKPKVSAKNLGLNFWQILLSVK